MYKADGIDLTQTEFDELKFMLSCGDSCSEKVQMRTESDPTLAPAYKELDKCKLATAVFAMGGVVINANPTRAGRDWLISYEKAIADEAADKRREWKKIAVNISGAAIAGGVMSLLVTLVLHFGFGL